MTQDWRKCRRPEDHSGFQWCGEVRFHDLLLAYAKQNQLLQRHDSSILEAIIEDALEYCSTEEFEHAVEKAQARKTALEQAGA